MRLRTWTLVVCLGGFGAVLAIASPAYALTRTQADAVALKASAAAGPVTYRYEITVKGSGSANLASPAASNTYTSESGQASGSFSVVYRIGFTLDRSAQTVAVESLVPTDQPGTITASSLSGVDSYSLTTTCVAGSGCNTPPVICSFSNVQISPDYLTWSNVYLEPTQGPGASHATYTAGTIAFIELTGGAAGPGPTIPCSNPANVVVPAANTIPGLTAPTCGSSGPGYTLDIPIDKLGQQHFSLAESGSGAADSGCAIGTSEHASYTITAADLNPAGPVTTKAQSDAAFLKELIASGVDLDAAVKWLEADVRRRATTVAGDAYVKTRLSGALNELYFNPPEMPDPANNYYTDAVSDIKKADRQLTTLEQNGTSNPTDIQAELNELNSDIEGAQSKLDELEEVL